MVRIRSLAKELRHLERQKEAATPSPVPPPSNAVPASNTEATASLERHSVSSSSSCAGGNKEGQEVEAPAAAAAASSPPTPQAEASAADTSVDSSPSSESLFAHGGSRFDILVKGSYGDGAACRRSDVRRAAKVCSNGKTALQREAEEAATSNAAVSSTTVAGAELSGERRITASATPSPPPPPPPGNPAGIPARPPYRRLLPQPFSHILVCDFEATCASGSVHYPHEIIEFPVVVLDTATLRIVAQFHRYVKPVRNPTLTAFCTELTGITQAMVDAADPLPVVVTQFQSWLEADVYPLCKAWAAHYGADKLARNLKSEQRRFTYDERTPHRTSLVQYESMICMATDGPWDMRRFMHECSVLRDGIEFPPVCYRYVNVRHSYGELLKCKQVKLTHMLRRLCMSFEGRRHSGIDDTRNITRVLAELMARGYRVHHVSTLKYQHRGDKFMESNQAAQELLSEYGEMDKTHTSTQNGKQSKRPSKHREKKT